MKKVNFEDAEYVEITLAGAVIANEGDWKTATFELDAEDLELMNSDREAFLDKCEEIALQSEVRGWWNMVRVEWMMPHGGYILRELLWDD